MHHKQMNNEWEIRINNALLKRKLGSSYRRRLALYSGNSKIILYRNKKYINFSSNDYLGLSRNNEVIKAWKTGADNFGIGSGGSGHTIGYSIYHQTLERTIANWIGFQRAILFTSGFSANQSVISALTNYGDYIFADRLSHASILEASIKSPATLKRFAHNNIMSLKKLLQNNDGNKFIVTEGVFSMDGDKAPLSDILNLIDRKKNLFMVDDAHGIGVLGEDGRGSVSSMKKLPDLLTITFGKAIGVSGAAILCSSSIAEYLLQFSRHLIYSTAIPTAQVLAISAAIKILRNRSFLRKKLLRNIDYFKKGASILNIKLLPSETAIQPFIIGDVLMTLKISMYLRKHGIWVSPIIPPTVPSGFSRLRITITALHNYDDIDKLLETLFSAIKNG